MTSILNYIQLFHYSIFTTANQEKKERKKIIFAVNEPTSFIYGASVMMNNIYNNNRDML